MKKKILTAVLLSALVLASCGSSDSSSEANKSNDANDIVVSNAQGTPASDSSETDESFADIPDPDESSDSSGEDITDSFAEYDAIVKSVDRSGTFMPASGEEITFGELYDQGYANVTAEGYGYCLVKGGGGAGNVFFMAYCTEDGGKTWHDGGTVSLFVGDMQFFTIEDGRLLILDKPKASDSSLPYVYVISMVGNDNDERTVKTEVYQQYFEGFVLDDGTALAPDSRVKVQGEYLGRYDLRLKITEEDTGNVLFDNDAVLDSVSLGLPKSDAAR